MEESCDAHLEQARLDRQRVQAIAAVEELLQVLVEVRVRVRVRG